MVSYLVCLLFCIFNDMGLYFLSSSRQLVNCRESHVAMGNKSQSSGYWGSCHVHHMWERRSLSLQFCSLIHPKPTSTGVWHTSKYCWRTLSQNLEVCRLGTTYGKHAPAWALVQIASFVIALGHTLPACTQLRMCRYPLISQASWRAAIHKFCSAACEKAGL